MNLSSNIELINKLLKPKLQSKNVGSNYKQQSKTMTSIDRFQPLNVYNKTSNKLLNNVNINSKSGVKKNSVATVKPTQ